MATFTVKEKATGRSVKNAWDIFESFQKLGRADQKSFWVLGADGSGREILRACVFRGGVKDMFTDPKVIFKRLIMSGATAWVAVHNHPEGDPQPSAEDTKLLSLLIASSELLTIPLLDFIIVTENAYWSFHEQVSPQAHATTRMINLLDWKKEKEMPI